MPPVRRVIAPIIALACVVTSVAAHADPPRSESDPCRGRHAGDPCEADDFEGTCRSRRCTRETDDGVRTSRCLVCESRSHGHHHRHHDHDAAPEPDDATAASDVAPADVAEDVTPDVAAVPDVAAAPDVAPTVAPRPSAPPPKESFFACATSPHGGDGAGWCVVAFALCSAFQGRVMGRARRRTGTSL